MNTFGVIALCIGAGCGLHLYQILWALRWLAKQQPTERDVRPLTEPLAVETQRATPLLRPPSRTALPPTSQTDRPAACAPARHRRRHPAATRST